MTEQYQSPDEAEPQYSGPYGHDPRDPALIGEVLVTVSDLIETAARQNQFVAKARTNLRNLLDPKDRGDREVSDTELGDALLELGRALRGDKDEGTSRPQ
jgi:hypothetical protein